MTSESGIYLNNFEVMHIANKININYIAPIRNDVQILVLRIQVLNFSIF